MAESTERTEVKMDTSSVAARNKAAVAEFFSTAESDLEAFFDRLMASLDPDFVVYQAAGLPYGGEYHGVEGFTRVQEKIREELLDLRVEDLELVAEGDTVITLFRMLGRSKSTGQEYDMRQVEVWRLRDGKPISLTPYYYDTHQIRKIMGLA